MTSKPKVKAFKRVVKYPDDGFYTLDGNLHCNYCDCHVSWLHKTDVLKHTQTANHGKAKKRPLHSDTFWGEGPSMHNITVGAGSQSVLERTQNYCNFIFISMLQMLVVFRLVHNYGKLICLE